MEIITNVGVSYFDHINGDVPKVNRFFVDVTRLSPPPVFEVRAWERG